jgi:hypothetical protein
MELFQGVLFVAHADGTPCRVVDHDRVAVIDDVQRGRVVIEPYGREFGFLRIANVNRRLMVPAFAGGKFRLQVAPVAGTLVSVVAPVRGFVLLSKPKRGPQKYHQNHV